MNRPSGKAAKAKRDKAKGYGRWDVSRRPAPPSTQPLSQIIKPTVHIQVNQTFNNQTLNVIRVTEARVKAKLRVDTDFPSLASLAEIIDFDTSP
jgi:hypothetical protein